MTPDHNGYRQEGLHVAEPSIHRGLRWSASRAYLRPALSRPSLKVLQRALVRRVVAENGAVTGIEVEGQPGGSRLISCRKEVFVCGGAVNTPKLLLLSGIGPADELRSAPSSTGRRSFVSRRLGARPRLRNS